MPSPYEESFSLCFPLFVPLASSHEKTLLWNPNPITKNIRMYSTNTHDRFSYINENWEKKENTLDMMKNEGGENQWRRKKLIKRALKAWSLNISQLLNQKWDKYIDIYKGFANLDQQKTWRSKLAKAHLFCWSKLISNFC